MEEYQEEMSESIMDAICCVIDDEWEDDIQRTYFRIEKDDTGDEINEEDEQNFRKQFVQDHTVDEVIELLKKSKDFREKLATLIKTYADEEDIPTYLAGEYEPDWESIEEFRRAS